MRITIKIKVAVMFSILASFAVFLSEASAVNLKDADKLFVGSLKGLQVSKRTNEIADIPFYDELGNSRKISHFKGNFIILNIWATWCVPCREEMLSLDHLQHSFKDEKLVVLAISQDRAGDKLVKKFYKEMQIKHLDVFIDSQGKAKRMTGTFLIPTTIIIDPHGVEIGRLLGGTNWGSKEVFYLMRHLLEE